MNSKLIATALLLGVGAMSVFGATPVAGGAPGDCDVANVNFDSKIDVADIIDLAKILLKQ